MENLPIYKIVVNEEDDQTGVDFISLVDEPATEFNWMAFKNHKINFKADQDKKMIYGVFIAADKPIYRNDNGFEYYTVFDKDTIFKIVKKFNKNNYNRNINFQHMDKMVQGYVVENFITSDKVKADFGYEVPEGSWFGSVYIEDENFWESYIKKGELKGFSVEILSGLENADNEYKIEKLKAILKSNKGKHQKIKELKDLF